MYKGSFFCIYFIIKRKGVEVMKVNFFGEVLKLNKVNNDLWVSEVTEEDVCLVFQRYEGVWYRDFYTTDEIATF